MPIWVGVIVSGLISLIYIAIGGILADLWTDFIQFIVQVIAGLALFIGVIMKLGDYGLSIFSVFSALPEANVSVFNAGRGQGSLSWTLLYFFVIFFSYSGGTWNLAARFISTSNAKEAKKQVCSPQLCIWFGRSSCSSPCGAGPCSSRAWIRPLRKPACMQL